MRRWLGLAVVALMLAVPAASASPWTQTTYDAARTGHSQDAGPATNDTAFVAPMPGKPTDGPVLGPPEPLVVDGSVYVPVEPTSPDDGLDALGIARVDLATAETTLLAETNTTPHYLATANGTLFVTQTNWMTAFDRATGEQLWSVQPPIQGTERGRTTCRAPAVWQGLLVTACTQVDRASGPEGTQDAPRARTFAWAVDAGTGELAWAYAFPAVVDEEQAAMERIEDPTREPAPGEASPLRFAVGISAIGNRIYVSEFRTVEDGRCDPTDTAACYSSSDTAIRLWALSAHREGAGVEWTNRTMTRGNTCTATTVGSNCVGEVDLPALDRHVTGTERVIYTKLSDRLVARSADDGRPLWSERLGQKDTLEATSGMSSAFTGDAVYTVSAQTLYRFDVDGPLNAWEFAAQPNEEFGWGSVIVADGTVYVAARDYDPDYNAVYAVDTDTGDRIWRKHLTVRDEVYEDHTWSSFSYALGDGVLVAAGDDGTLHVVGRTPASLGEPPVEASTSYPAVGENVSVSLSGTEPGALGNATQFRADWGDGNTTGWQQGPGLTHAYADAGNVTARFYAANDANQTASTTVTFHVGQEAPAEPNWVEKRFQKDNQDMTFGVLGLAVALGGGAIGVARRKRKQSLLQDELEALEQGFERTRDNPGECEAFLDTRKARAQSLLLDGDLDEEQFGVLERRIDELHGELRTSVLDARFAFLPHGMVQSLKKMLADGRISTWEHEAIADLLEREETLSEAQKEKVRSQLDRWFAEDAGGDAP